MQNFGKIKNAFNGILAEGIVSKNEKNKLLFKNYVKTIKENEILKTQFFIYDNIENKIENNEFKATQFVQENINLLNKFSKDEIIEANLMLSKPIIFEQDSNGKVYKEELYENITTLIFTEKNAKNIDKIVEATANIVNHIKSNVKMEVSEAIDLPSTLVSNIMVYKYNEKYSTLDESDKNVLRALIASNDEEKKEVYSTTLKECISLINEKLKDSDLETKDKLLRVKEKLLNDPQDINEHFEKNISRLIELKGSLKE